MTRAWTEAELLDYLLRPAAMALDNLLTREVTHRAIRPDNLFRSAAGQPVVLGSFWAAPPASLQPALYEPPYVAMCPPAARGDGSIADDVYALGVTLLVLATGRKPLAGLDDQAITSRKLEIGSYQALIGDARLSPTIADLLRAMLAEDPEHRSVPALLCDPSAARARRVAARPPRRAPEPIELGRHTAWDARTLAFALADEPTSAGRLLRGGTVERWLRRSVGDVALATRVEETLRKGDASGDDPLGETVSTMRVIAMLDPLAPLCWRGLAFWPDAIGPLLAANSSDPRIEEAVQNEAIASWSAMRPERCNAAAVRLDAKLHRSLLRIPGWGGGKARLRYALNPTIACASPLLDGFAVTSLAALLFALNACERREPDGSRPIDREIAAFIAARHDQRTEAELAAICDPKDAASGGLDLLRLLAGMQARFAPQSRLPRLAGWLASYAAPALETWQNRARRSTITAALAEISATGQLSAMVALLDDPSARAEDERASYAATASVEAIDAELAGISGGAGLRAEAAQRAGAEIAAASGALALAAAVVAAVLG